MYTYNIVCYVGGRRANIIDALEGGHLPPNYAPRLSFAGPDTYIYIYVFSLYMYIYIHI